MKYNKYLIKINMDKEEEKNFDNCDHHYHEDVHKCGDENSECSTHDITKASKNAKKQLLLKNIKNMFTFFAACFAACLFGCGCFLCLVVVINLLLLQIIACAGAYRIVCWTVS
jgi:hypothetical protein